MSKHSSCFNIDKSMGN